MNGMNGFRKGAVIEFVGCDYRKTEDKSYANSAKNKNFINTEGWIDTWIVEKKDLNCNQLAYDLIGLGDILLVLGDIVPGQIGALYNEEEVIVRSDQVGDYFFQLKNVFRQIQ